MSQVDTTAEPGWRPDPSGRFDWRYWDGGWTNRVANAERSAGPMPRSRAAPAAAPAPRASRSAPVAAPSPVASAVPAPAPRRSPPSPAVPIAAAAAVAPLRAVSSRAIRCRRAVDRVAPAPLAAAGSPAAHAVGVVRSRSSARSPTSRSRTTRPDRAEAPAGPTRESTSSPRPGNYGLAGLVALAACGIAGGAYLPWLSGTIDGIPFHQSGFDMGHGLGYSVGAAALALSALLVGPDADPALADDGLWPWCWRAS